MSVTTISDRLPHPWSDRAWQSRLRQDARLREDLDSDPGDLLDIVVSRLLEHCVEAIVLTGSTARGQRTALSDLDIYVVGSRPPLDDLPGSIDLRATSAAKLDDRLREGDDYVQWALRYGCVLHDTGVLSDAARIIVNTDLWPDPERKRSRASLLLDLAACIVESGDSEAAEEAVRGALTAVAHWILLANRVFPLCRNELPDQIHDLGSVHLAAALHRSIHDEPLLGELDAAVRLGRHAIELPAQEARQIRDADRITDPMVNCAGFKLQGGAGPL